MGSCAGCTNPERRLRPMKQQLNTEQKQNKSKPLHARTTSKQGMYSSMNIYNFQSETKPKMLISQDPWRSRISPSRVVKKYIKQPTLKEEECRKETTIQDNSVADMKDLKQVQGRSIRAESLEESIALRNRMSPELAKEKYGHEYQQRFCEQPQQIKQILESEMNLNSSFDRSPANRNFNPKFQYSHSPIFDYDQIDRQSQYLPKKADKMREKQLEQVLQMFEKQAETPNYVRKIRKEQGEDIRMDNFCKFEPIPDFKGFCLGEYLGQLQDVSQSVSKQKDQIVEQIKWDKKDGKERNLKTEAASPMNKSVRLSISAI